MKEVAKMEDKKDGDAREEETGEICTIMQDLERLRWRWRWPMEVLMVSSLMVTLARASS